MIGILDGLTSISSLPNRPARGRTKRQHRPRELREAGIAPAKTLGQHFLTDRGVVNRIVLAAGANDVDALIEVGPGLGALTERLMEVEASLIAVEMDASLAARLREKYPENQVRIVEADVLRCSPADLLVQAGVSPVATFGVVGNLPYNAGVAIVRHFLESEPRPSWLVVMLQREVAEAICASPGRLSTLGVSIQVYARPSHLFNVQPRAFYPSPKVTSTVLRLDVRPEPLVTPADREGFFKVVRAGFSAPRKRLRNSLSDGLQRPPAEVQVLLEHAGIDPNLRPGALAVEDWLNLASTLREL